MTSSIEVPQVGDLEVLGLGLEVGDEPHVLTVTAWTHDESPVALTWDEVARSIGLRWSSQEGHTVSLARELITRVTVTNDGPGVRFDVWSQSDDLAGKLTIRVGKHVTIDDALLEI